MTDPRELFQRAAPSPRGDVNVDDLRRRSRRRRRGRRQLGAGLVVLIALLGVVVVSNRSDHRRARVSTDWPSVTTSPTVAGPDGSAALWSVVMVSPTTVFAA